MSNNRCRLLVLCFIFHFSLTLKANPHPLLEWGFFIGHGLLADYPASNEYRYRTIPFPYLSYHGDILSSDNQDGTRIRLLKNKSFDFDLSFGGSFPTDTDKNQARLGMPKLDWTLEVGPRLLYYFYKNPEFASLRVGIPLRTSVSTDFLNWKHIGYVFSPTLQFDRYKIFTDNLDLYSSLTFNFADKGESNYFYKVDANYQTLAREQFEAKSGFLSWDFSFAGKYEWNQKIILFGINYADFSNSENRNSPLFKTNSNTSYFIGFGWILFQSEVTAKDKG